MTSLVTGGAGFIGSHLVEALLARGERVRVVDSFTDYYAPATKRANLRAAAADPNCEVIEADLLTADLDELLSGIDVLFHQAGQPGVRGSWGAGFEVYERNNITATQRLLEACRGQSLRRFVQASSSSIYGNATAYPTHESDLPQPISPYGVTKLAAEHLCHLYAHARDIPTIALRYFTVFGPRQRPDMAFHRLFASALEGQAFPLYGTGEQRRDFTFVDDIVRGNLAAADADVPAGTVVNLAGGSDASLRQVIEAIERISGRRVTLDEQGAKAGDVERTGGATDLARERLGWQPATTLEEGLRRQYEWHVSQVAAPAGSPKS